ncbi:WD40 repeat domain-containing protein [Streptomyces yaizuensis]|uniref:WD40 repeat domain-containing protein n=1 Tax=Streptomyces yaizuensis TaxID=2989713 RepID=A0ABQ5NY84_9ACTN|nr:WD40 repeat domain-containing protein [Streptomyces sp. YSPA8]GLF95323.1 hypothetical protein SYYSPA8_13520 [Streptomyces sp. YSPA8]
MLSAGRAVAFSPDARTAAFATDSRTTFLTGMVSGETTVEHPGGRESELALALDFSPDGRTLASSFGTAVRLREAHSGRLRTTLTGHRGRVIALAHSADGRLLAAGDTHGEIRLWDIRTGRAHRTLRGHSDEIGTLAFNSTGTLASSGEDGTVRLWNTTTGAHRILTRTAARIDRSARAEDDLEPLVHASPVGFSPDGRTAAVSHENGTVGLWDTRTRQLRRTLGAQSGRAHWAVFSPDGKTLATTSDQATVIHLWDVAGGTVRATLTGHPSRITELAFSQDSGVLFTADGGGIRQWDVRDPLRHSIPIRPRGDATSMIFTRDGKTLLTSDSTGADPGKGLTPLTNPEGTVRLWDLSARRLRLTITGTTGAFALSPDHRTIALIERDGTITFRDMSTGHIRLTLPSGRPHSRPRTLAFSPDGTTFATRSNDGMMQFWDTDLLGTAAAIDRLCRAVGNAPVEGFRSTLLSPCPTDD